MTKYCQWTKWLSIASQTSRGSDLLILERWTWKLSGKCLSARFENGKTICSTRSYHHLSPISGGEVSNKRVSDDEVVAGTFKFFDIVLADQISDIKIMDFIVCQYESL